MGNMKTWWVFGFEWWGGLRPAEMTTAKGVRFVPMFWGLWLRRPTKRGADFAPGAIISLEPLGSHASDPFAAQDEPQNH